MEIDVDIKTNNSTPHAVRDQFAKMILGASASFITQKLVENLYDSIVERRQNKTKEPQL